MATKTLDEHTEVTPDIAGAKARIRGRRISVQDIAIWYDHLSKTADEIASEYDLTLCDVHAALAYYFDHRERSTRAWQRIGHSRRERQPQAGAPSRQ